jgi:polyphenol oxidase
MPFRQTGNIRYYTFESFNECGICHAIFTRHGGVSVEPWKSLNLGGTVGDDPDNVIENRERIFGAINRDTKTAFDVWQVHSTEVVCTDLPRPPSSPHSRADAILTQRTDVTLFMRFADCVPIMLVDPIRHVVGLVHAGWMGTVGQIVVNTIKAMHNKYGTNTADILAGIGPSICVEHYPVGKDVIDQVKQSFGDAVKLVIEDLSGQQHFNLWEANRLLLERVGVKNIEISAICTAHNTEDWYSHRAEKGRTGRFGALIALSDVR